MTRGSKFLLLTMVAAVLLVAAPSQAVAACANSLPIAQCGSPAGSGHIVRGDLTAGAGGSWETLLISSGGACACGGDANCLTFVGEGGACDPVTPGLCETFNGVCNAVSVISGGDPPFASGLDAGTLLSGRVDPNTSPSWMASGVTFGLTSAERCFDFDWAAAGVDGCPADEATQDPMLALVTDTSQNSAWMATTFGSGRYDFSSLGTVQLLATEAPAVNSSSNNLDGTVEVSVNAFSGLNYSDDGSANLSGDIGVALITATGTCGSPDVAVDGSLCTNDPNGPCRASGECSLPAIGGCSEDRFPDPCVVAGGTCTVATCNGFAASELTGLGPHTVDEDSLLCWTQFSPTGYQFVDGCVTIGGPTAINSAVNLNAAKHGRQVRFQFDVVQFNLTGMEIVQIDELRGTRTKISGDSLFNGANNGAKSSYDVTLRSGPRGRSYSLVLTAGAEVTEFPFDIVRPGRRGRR